uniref:Tudor-knot domain-containing protein n=1 Tax=Amphilophus citrinellus TaxID=61819 RepID=A0A3Q0R7Z9_AMPCI
MTHFSTPPDRSGIIFEVGAKLEARDRQKNWYTATIEKIDYDRERILIHYQQWSRRHDEWFQWNSPYLRPMERVSLRRQGLNPPQNSLSVAAVLFLYAPSSQCTG